MNYQLANSEADAIFYLLRDKLEDVARDTKIPHSELNAMRDAIKSYRGNRRGPSESVSPFFVTMAEYQYFYSQGLMRGSIPPNVPVAVRDGVKVQTAGRYNGKIPPLCKVK